MSTSSATANRHRLYCNRRTKEKGKEAAKIAQDRNMNTHNCRPYTCARYNSYGIFATCRILALSVSILTPDFLHDHVEVVLLLEEIEQLDDIRVV